MYYNTVGVYYNTKQFFSRANMLFYIRVVLGNTRAVLAVGRAGSKFAEFSLRNSDPPAGRAGSYRDCVKLGLLNWLT